MVLCQLFFLFSTFFSLMVARFFSFCGALCAGAHLVHVLHHLEAVARADAKTQQLGRVRGRQAPAALVFEQRGQIVADCARIGHGAAGTAGKMRAARRCCCTPSTAVTSRWCTAGPSGGGLRWAGGRYRRGDDELSEQKGGEKKEKKKC